MGRKLPKIITKEEYEALFKAVQKAKHKRKKEYLLAVILAAEAGLRISEILGYERKNGNPIQPLTKEQIDLKGHRIQIRGAKGDKDRVVPCPKKLGESVMKMLPLKIKRRALQRFITNLGWNVLHKSISFHTLRHYFGTQCAETMQLHQVQILMGHSNLSTTGIYLHANPTKAIEAAREVKF